jgi:hypothetical protein
MNLHLEVQPRRTRRVPNNNFELRHQAEAEARCVAFPISRLFFSCFFGAFFRPLRGELHL